MATDGFLTFDDGVVMLGNQAIPGVLVGQTIRNAVRYDQSKGDHMSGKRKVMLGWEDSVITLTLDLLCDAESDCYAKLAIINSAFKAAGAKNAAPRIYEVTGRHLRARGISRVVFDSLDSDETDRDDTIVATLNFTEHLPPVIKREKRTNARNIATAAATAAPRIKATPAVSPAVAADTTNPFMAGLYAGGN